MLRRRACSEDEDGSINIKTTVVDDYRLLYS